MRFVQVTHENFDQHADHYPRQEELIRQLDQAMSSLITDLDERGLLQHTVQGVDHQWRTGHTDQSQAHIVVDEHRREHNERERLAEQVSAGLRHHLLDPADVARDAR